MTVTPEYSYLDKWRSSEADLPRDGVMDSENSWPAVLDLKTVLAGCYLFIVFNTFHSRVHSRWFTTMRYTN